MGAAVVVAELDGAAAESTAIELRHQGHQALVVRTDVTSRADLGAMVQRTFAAFGRIDILVNNAGIYRAAATLDVSPSALLIPIEELIHANLLVEHDDKLAFSHDLTLEAVRASIPLSARRALDRQAALVLLAGVMSCEGCHCFSLNRDSESLDTLRNSPVPQIPR